MQEDLVTIRIASASLMVLFEMVFVPIRSLYLETAELASAWTVILCSYHMAKGRGAQNSRQRQLSGVVLNA